MRQIIPGWAALFADVLLVHRCSANVGSDPGGVFVPAIAFLASLRSAEHRERATDGSCALSASVTAARVVALDLQGAPHGPHLHPEKPQDR